MIWSLPGMSRKTASFLIALLFHLVLILLFWLLATTVPKLPPKKPKEHRFKVSLKERPESKKNAAVKNRVKIPKKVPPMPKGGQLKKIVTPPPSKPLPKPKEQIKVEPPVPVKPHQKVPKPAKVTKTNPSKPKTEPVPAEKPNIPYKEISKPVKEKKPAEETKIASSEENRTIKVPKQHRGLFAKLSKKQKTAKTASAQHNPHKRESRINQDVKELYGDEFGKLSEGEQKYILDNQEIMRRITQQVLNRVGRVNIPSNMRINADNVIEFYLYPNGDISDIKFIKRSGFYILDDTTKETIEYAYSRYPRPKQKTLIRYKVGYFLRGY